MKKPILMILLSTLIFPFWAQKTNYHLLIGTYTNTYISEGIYVYDVDLENGIFTQKSVAKGVSNPCYLALSADKKLVYAVNETGSSSAVSSFAFDEVNAKLTPINMINAPNDDPCFLSVTKNHVFTANYSGGSISVFGRKADGSLTEPLQVIQHRGNSVDPKRQTAPHVHQVTVTSDGKFVVANDLGTDKVTVYKYNKRAVKNILMPYDSISVKPGSGPRHITFSKNGKRAYLLHEMDGTVSVMEMKKGKLRLLQETSVDIQTGIENGAADIHLSPDGRFLYATNRGTANDISRFELSVDGTLTFVSQISTGGIGPRNFAITPDGNFVLEANQRSNSVAIFQCDTKTGALTDTGKRIKVGAPVCLLFY